MNERGRLVRRSRRLPAVKLINSGVFEFHLSSNLAFQARLASRPGVFTFHLRNLRSRTSNERVIRERELRNSDFRKIRIDKRQKRNGSGLTRGKRFELFNNIVDRDLLISSHSDGEISLAVSRF